MDYRCGDVHEGGESDIIRIADGERIFKQICSGSIANKAPKEHEAIVTNIIRGHSDSLCNGWQMRHGKWTRHRNYAILTAKRCKNVPVIDVFYQVSFEDKISSEMETSSRKIVPSKFSLKWVLSTICGCCTLRRRRVQPLRDNRDAIRTNRVEHKH